MSRTPNIQRFGEIFHKILMGESYDHHAPETADAWEAAVDLCPSLLAPRKLISESAFYACWICAHRRRLEGIAEKYPMLDFYDVALRLYHESPVRLLEGIHGQYRAN